MLEKGVRFVQIFSGGAFGSPRINWDGHEDMRRNHGREAPRIEWLPNPTGVPIWLIDRWAAFFWSLLITGSTMAIVTAIAGREPHDATLSVKQEGWLARSSEALPPLLESPFKGRTPWFADPRADRNDRRQQFDQIGRVLQDSRG